MFSFHIPNMTCGGCAKTVTRILHGVDPQARVETDPPRREARVESTLDKHALSVACGTPMSPGALRSCTRSSR
ncbi:heavy-metal-associated domain-containing protein [Pseudomonas aeruginosa]|uniref:heavy-metal-associated domain-containing protein n=1 Tax=Pseudomonas aeruginosa TaxID=287 RepID=UPI0009A452B2|nr:heavy-metal-associated domain-containing protein [Pseudomonas aeruginosa]